MEILTNLFGTDLDAALIIVINLIIIESLLSIDNAAVLATMVMDLPVDQRGRALRYGILGAYLFRGLSLIFVSLLLELTILKLLGGIYLVWLTARYFYTKSTPQKDDDLLEKKQNWLYRSTFGVIGPFWSTVVLVEFMDLSFSIDNVFAAVAFTDNLVLICTGVFIGILAMRFAAQIFVNLMNRFPFLEQLAFLVIAVLGLKLTSSYACEHFPGNPACTILDSHNADFMVSVITIGIFVVPVISSYLFNFPKRDSSAFTKKD